MEAALIKKYEDALLKDPNSRVFAQLGEIYRKLNMYDQALRIYKEGVKRHPAYVLGYLGLANCYFDLEQFPLAYATLRPLVESARDNIRLQKLFANCCEKLDYKDEALETWKYLLFISPKDNEIAAKVHSLENNDTTEPKPVESTSFVIDQLTASPLDDIDDWVRMDLEQSPAVINKPALIKPAEKEVKEKVESAPIMSLTLVELYLKQNHREKAIELLERMLELNPSDERILSKMKEIQADEPIISNEDEGHSRLLNLVEQKQEKLAVDESPEVIEELNTFLQKIKSKAQEKSTYQN